MTDNFEDLEHHDAEHAEEVPPKGGLRSNLAEAWRTRPLFKLLVVMTVAGAAIAAGANFFSSGPPAPTSRMPSPPELNQPPGGKASPYLIQQTEKAEAQREKEALASGGSSLPTPIGQNNDINLNDKNDQLNELRAETTRLKMQLTEVQNRQAQPPPQTPQQQQQAEHFDESLATAMQQQMHQLMESWVPHGIKEVSVSKDEKPGTTGGAASSAGSSGSATNTAANTKPAASAAKALVPAGTVSYAQLLVEANSDVPGPILAQIVSGPLSGARAVGSFQIANGYSDYLVLHFTHANLKGKDYSIDAYALDPDTTLGGMATEVDERYFTRILLPAAASFLQGLGSALGQSNTTTTASSGLAIVSQPSVGIDQGLAQGMGQAAQVASQFFQNQANQTRPLVRVAAGTPMGVFFINSVFDPSSQPPPTAAPPGTGVAGQSYPPGYPTGSTGYPGMPYGMNPMAQSYPGMTSAGYSGYPAQGNPSGVPYPNAGMPSSTVNGYGGYGATPRISPFGSGVYP